MYAGHHTDGSSLQAHSVGGIYPYIVFARQQGDKLAWGVLAPDATETYYPTNAAAVNAALDRKEADADRRQRPFVH